MANVGADEIADVQIAIKDVEIVYIPYLEKNETVLIPAYKLTMVETWENGMSGEYRYIMDVFTGYVYERMMISE